MSLFSFTKKNSNKYSLVFNIGSGSVSGGIIKFTEKVGENVIYFTKENIPFQQEVSVPRHLDLMKSTLITLANKIQTEGIKKLITKNKNKISFDRVFYIFSSPWCISQTKTIRVKESKPFKVTESYLNKIIDEQEHKFQAEIAGFGSIIEKKIIQIKANGYIVNDINNKTIKDLEISVFFTVVPEKILNVIEKAVSKTFNINNVWCHSFPLAAFSVIRNLFPQNEDFIFMDISEEITDISIIKDNIIVSNASIPLGRNHFVRNLSRVLKVSKEIADSMIKIHCAKDHDQLASLRLSMSMDDAAKEWLNKIFETLDSLKNEIYVPESIFLITTSDLIPFLKEKLEKHDFSVLLINNNKVKSTVAVDDLIFKLELMFLDNIYKI